MGCRLAARRQCGRCRYGPTAIDPNQRGRRRCAERNKEAEEGTQTPESPQLEGKRRVFHLYHTTIW